MKYFEKVFGAQWIETLMKVLYKAYRANTKAQSCFINRFINKRTKREKTIKIKTGGYQYRYSCYLVTQVRNISSFFYTSSASLHVDCRQVFNKSSLLNIADIPIKLKSKFILFNRKQKKKWKNQGLGQDSGVQAEPLVETSVIYLWNRCVFQRNVQEPFSDAVIKTKKPGTKPWKKGILKTVAAYFIERFICFTFFEVETWSFLCSHHSLIL